MVAQSAEKPSEARRRRIVCEACGAEFGCTLGGPCWCSDEPFLLPMPLTGEAQDGPRDCLCPTCLRARAQAGR